MSLDDRQLHEVTRGVRHRVPVHDQRLELERLRHHLVLDQPDRACRSTLPRDREVRRGDGMHADRLADPLGHLGARHVLDRTAALQHELGHEALEVSEDEEVGDVPGRDGAVPGQAVPLGRMQRRHEDRVRGLDPERDGVADHPVHVAVVGDVLGIAVVGAEGDPPGAVLRDERKERFEVSRHRRLADQEPHPGAKALAPLLHREGLVVRADPGRRVRLEGLAEDSRRVTVDVLGSVERELLELGRIPGDDPGEVHHLGQAEDAAPPHQRLEVARRERPPGGLERRGGDARRRHEEDLELEAGRRVVQPVDAVAAEDVRDLVRVGDDRGRPEREDEARELVDEELHRLEVHVRVDEAGHDEAPRRVDRLLAVVGADAGDDAVHDRDVRLEPLAGEHGEDPAAADDEIRGRVAPGDGEASLETRHRADDNGTAPPDARPADRLTGARSGKISGMGGPSPTSPRA